MQTVKNDTRAVPLAEIQTHPALQPRALFLIDLRDQARQERQSEEHIGHMAQVLKSNQSEQLAPITLADVEGVLYVVDGHHRLRAYKAAKRETVPATVRAATLRQAHQAAQVANLEGAKLAMHIKQRRSALWQYLATVTEQGNLPLPSGESQRTLAGRFGVARDTVQRMLARLPEVAPEAYPPEHRDAITGWPHWRYVCSSARSEGYQRLQPQGRLEWQAEKYLKALLKLWDRFPPQAVALAHQRMRADVATEEAEARLGSDADATHALVHADEQTAEF